MMPKFTSSLIVDTRWNGRHGIGRYSSEVLSRLNMQHSNLRSNLKPTNPFDVLLPARLKLRSYQLVYSPGFNAGITRAKQILTIHDLIHLEVFSGANWLKKMYYQFFVKRAVRNSGTVFTVSSTSAKKIEAWAKCPELQISVTGCGVSEAFTLDGAMEKFERPTFVAVGNFKTHKNLEPLMEAISYRPEYDLILVTNDKSKARRESTRFGISDQVSIRSNLSDEELATLYRGSSGLVFPSILEGFGLPPLEAMNCGLRVAYWEGCESVHEICFEMGVSVNCHDSAQEWAEAMDNLYILNSEQPFVPPENWRNKYSWEKTASQVQEVLSQQFVNQTGEL